MPVLLWILSALCCAGCGDHGFFITTVDPGPDFAVADVVFEPNYFYCKVEPVLFKYRCGSGDSTQGDPAGGCHFNGTSYRLTDYMPRVGDSCEGGPVPLLDVNGVKRPRTDFPDAAQRNYQTSQARMKRDPDLAPLLQRPMLNQFHPRQIFHSDLPNELADADVIRQWATQFSNQ